MLKRGGWWQSMENLTKPLEENRYDEVTLASRLISWHSHLARPQEEAFGLALTLDLQRLGGDGKVTQPPGALKYTVDPSASYLAVMEEREVHVYAISRTSAGGGEDQLGQKQPGPSLRLMSTILCPRMVLKCDIDSSGKWPGIAVLMDRRVGMACDLPLPSKYLTVPLGGPSTRQWRSRTMFRSIGWENDPPRSVALNQSRSCVAFGCSQGIELHWVDVRTQRSVVTWVNLDSPSDCLYHVPPTKSDPASNCIQLLSSSFALPGIQTAIDRERSVTSSAPAWLQTAGLWPGQGGATFVPSQRFPLRLKAEAAAPVIATDNGVHGGRSQVAGDALPNHGPTIFATPRQTAIPLSDGHHILFIDTKSNLLCLGHKTPRGRFMYLSRRYYFRSPPDAASTRPILHTVGEGITHGARIVATFAHKEGARGGVGIGCRKTSQIIVLYTIPPDGLQTRHTGLEEASINDHGKWTRW